MNFENELIELVTDWRLKAAQGTEPEEVQATLNQCADRLDEAVSRYTGKKA